MGAQDISLFSLLLLCVFLVPIVWLNRHFHLGINKSILTSVFRMGLQLGFVGLYLEFLFSLNSPVLNCIYLLIMTAIACQSILKSTRLNIKAFFIPLFFSLLIPFPSILFFFNFAVARIDNLFDAKYLIPIGGMLLGNSLKSIIVGLNSFYAGIKNDEKTYLSPCLCPLTACTR